VATAGVFASIMTLLIKLRKEIHRHQKEMIEIRLAEERRIIALENRIALVEQQSLYQSQMLNERLSELNLRLNAFYDFLCNQPNLCRYEYK
ncbi:MAG: hypothetical protein ACK42Z_09005, partial [Candidatus Kapaibacteriota bacterium]